VGLQRLPLNAQLPKALPDEIRRGGRHDIKESIHFGLEPVQVGTDVLDVQAWVLVPR
jgi:hypothetical protein